MLKTLEWKFFPRDVIGPKPEKVGDVFKAEVFGRISKFKVKFMPESAGYYMAVLAD